MRKLYINTCCDGRSGGGSALRPAWVFARYFQQAWEEGQPRLNIASTDGERKKQQDKTEAGKGMVIPKNLGREHIKHSYILRDGPTILTPHAAAQSAATKADREKRREARTINNIGNGQDRQV